MACIENAQLAGFWKKLPIGEAYCENLLQWLKFLENVIWASLNTATRLIASIDMMLWVDKVGDYGG